MIKIDWKKFFHNNMVFGHYYYEGEWVAIGEGRHATFVPVMNRRFSWQFIKLGIVKLK